MCLVLLLAGASLAAWRAFSIQQELRRGMDELNLALTSLTEKPFLDLTVADFDEGSRHLKSAEEAIAPVRQELGPFEPLLTFIGGDAGAVLPLTDLGLHGTRAGLELHAGLRPLLLRLEELRANGASGEQDTLREALALLRGAQPGLERAREHIDGAIAAYERVDGASLSGEVSRVVARLDRYAPRLGELRDATSILSDSPDLLSSLLGIDGRKTYLVLAQNNDELRPVGGFISTFGVVVLEDGKLIAHDFMATTSPLLKAPTEPCPSPSPSWWIQLKNPAWACWDAQWTGDFPTLAQQAKWFYDTGGNRYAPVDGVIALDLTATALLLKALGPVNVAEFDEEITGDNLRERIYFYRRIGSETGVVDVHKEFVGAIFRAVVNQHLERIPIDSAPALFEAVEDAVTGKHLLFFFIDPELQDLAARLGADGAILPTPDNGDYLHVVDTSLQEKVFGAVQEEIDYYGEIDVSGTITSRVTVTWTFPQEALTTDPPTANAARGRSTLPWLLNFTRIYLPGKGRWLAMGEGRPGYFDTEAGKLIVGTRVDVHAGETRSIEYNYVVPAVLERDGENFVYKLLVQKQPGKRAFPLRVRLALPPGATLLSATPEGQEKADGEAAIVEFDTTLERDKTFTIVFR